MPLARRVGAILLALAAIVVWFAMAPDESSDRSSDIASALADYGLNEARTHGAPQQQVVNGWVAKDLLTIIAEQQNDSVTDERLPALAVLVVLGLALHIATSTRPAEADGAASASAAPAADPSPEPSPAV
ncbi:hypothetical protein [Geodermatophilus marinus]|uniref:hypothetical protein n=1 Tax=Geodermatophilus sp. LHW52908 TaxID=2303986 RepID=UPI000E3D081C|nr:hypothetical protein [Geodermatophilus sp. LHW52908]RFU19914.1 hypothetical protein D0Z06_19200 [Geodermatophilus sp. LHW52908]